jgi:hypothetical protein
VLIGSVSSSRLNRHSMDTTPTARRAYGRFPRRADLDDAASVAATLDPVDAAELAPIAQGSGNGHSSDTYTIPGRSPPQHTGFESRLHYTSSPDGSGEDEIHDYLSAPLRYWEASASTYGGPGMPVYLPAEERVRQQQLLRGSLPGKRVASVKALASLQTVKIADLPENERSCIICYNEFGVENPEGINEAPLRLPKCKHVFGDHCIKKWFEESDSCPYCRDRLPSESQYRRQHALAGSFANYHAFMPHRHVSRGELVNRATPGGSTTASTSLMDLYDSPAYHRRDGESRRRRNRHGSLRGSPPSSVCEAPFQRERQGH